VLLEEVPASPLKAKVVALKAKIAALLGKGKAGGTDDPNAAATAADNPSDHAKDAEVASVAASDGPRLRHGKS
jgi:hypothetical protein